MDAATVNQYITETFPGVESVDDAGNRFFFAGPDRRMPFSTLVTGDRYDTASNLDRPGVFRLNIGVSRATFQALFGAEPTKLGDDGIAETSEDFTALDRSAAPGLRPAVLGLRRQPRLGYVRDRAIALERGVRAGI
jgi:hypothetical protein